ncbi:MAG: RNA polymerase sigma factor [Anaerolineae bacterium]
MDEGEERDLITRAKSDPEAFGELYQHYVGRIYSYHYRHTGNAMEAEDLTSRTFYRALRSLHRYREKGASFQAWLFRIAHNLVVNWYRDTSRHPSVAIDSVSPLHSPSPAPLDYVEAQETRELLLQLLADLPEDRKTLLILKYVEQMTNMEIAAVMGRSEGAIKALYHRTLVSLRDMIPEGWSDEV